MACELVLGSSFPELESHLLKTITELCRKQPFTPKWIFTPTSTLAEHCKLAFSRVSEETVLSGLHIVPFSQFTGNLSKSCGLQSIPRYHPTLDLLLFSLVQRLPKNSGLGDLGAHPSRCLALRPTFLDLADGGFGPNQIELLQDFSSEPGLTSIEALVLKLYVAWLETLEAANLLWEPLANQRLAQLLNDFTESEARDVLRPYVKEPSSEFFLYGFYDFTDVNMQIVAALGKQVKLTLYYPHSSRNGDPHPAFSFSEEVLNDLLVQLEPLHTRKRLLTESRISNPVAQFFADTFPGGECLSKPEFLTCQKASGIRAEIVSAAVRIRRWLDQKGGPIDLDEIMILVPEVELYYEEVREIFSAFAIPLRVVDQLPRGDPSERILLILKRLWQSRGDAEWLFSLFRECPSLLTRRHIDLNQFENKIRELPVSAGQTWQQLLDLVSAGDQRSLPPFDQSEIKLMDDLIEVWVDRPESGYSIEQASDLVQKIAESWLEDPAPLAPALQALQTMSELLPTLILPDEIFGLLFSLPEETRTSTNQFGQPGVLFSSIMRSRGITAEAIIVLGLSLGRFPARVEEDPLFSDSSRERLRLLARDVGHRLAVKSRAIDEMSLLFFLLNTSASTLHWVIPETDESGKSVAPTPWVQHYLHRWSSDSLWSEMPRGPIEQAIYLHSLDTETGSLLPPGYAGLLDPIMMESLHPDRNDPSRHGQIASSAFSAANHPERISVTELELLARCPYHFYARAVAGWKSIRPMSFVVEPDALEWGSLVHRCLERLFQPYLGSGVLLSDLAGSERQAAWLDFDQMAAYLPPRLRLLPEPLKLALIRRLSLTIEAYLDAVKSGKCSDGRLSAQEIKIRLPYPGKEYLTLSGQVDRVDCRQGQVHIVDYKSGQKPWASHEERSTAVRLGFLLQPQLYPWLYQNQEDLSYAPPFSFIFLGTVPPREVLISVPEGSMELLLSLETLVEKGNFFPTSTELMRKWGLKSAKPCRYCELNSICRRFDRDKQTLNERYFKALAQERFEAMTCQTGQEKTHDT